MRRVKSVAPGPGAGGMDAGVATGTAGAADAGTVGDAGPGVSPIPVGGMACGAATGGMCPDLDGNGTLDCQETLVMNPGFDTNITSWSAETGVKLSWDAAGDDDGKAGSGALVVQNANVINGSGFTLEGALQCVPVTAATYDFAAQLSIAPNQGYGAAVLSLLYYASGDCSGGAVGAAVSDQVTATGVCEELSMSRSVPSGVGSVKVRLTALKPFQQAPFAVEFDNVLFKKH